MDVPIKVLHIVTYMGRGGLETMIMNYYRKIDRTKVQFDFLVHRYERADYDDEIETLGGIIYRFPRLNPLDLRYIRKLEMFFREHKEYKIVHCHLDCMSAILLKAAKKANIPNRIAHAHSSNQDKNFKYILKMYYKKKIHSEATKLFACSETAGKWMFGKNEFDLLCNAIDSKHYSYNIEKRNSIRRELDLEDKVVIGHVGRFSPPKNHEFLIEVFEKIYRDNPQSRLLLIGDGIEKNSIHRKVKNLGLDSVVVFLGKRQNVAELMQAMDVFLFPSIYEGLGIALIEAQAAGLPCLCSSNIPVESMITDLVHPLKLEEKAELWAKKVLEIVKMERTDRKKEIIESGYDIDKNVELLQSFYLGIG